MINWSNFANFSESEFVCRCGCGRANMVESFIARLQRIRKTYDRPIIVTSGFRCPDHNEQVSSTGRTGPHTTGQAADIKVYGENVFYLAGIAYAMDMRGFGHKQHGPVDGRFLHLDDLPSGLLQPRPRIWTYP